MRREEFNRNWKFRRAEDTEGKIVTLPHDAMIFEKRSADNPSGSACASFAGGKYVYEKEFEVPADFADKHVVFGFEGVYRNAEVFINDKKAGGCAYGYVPFTAVADEYLEYGKTNVIKVTVDNSETPNSRWYSGSGIYRPVWMYIGEKAHIEYQGVRIKTLSYNPAKIAVNVAHVGGTAEVAIYDGEKKVASAIGDAVEFTVPEAKLWSDETPNLYECRVTLTEDGNVVDEVSENFGIRLIEWSAKGLFVNGKETLLRGGCVHHDNGLLGACSYKESEWRRVKRLKEMGYNAIRSSHNPCAVEMLNACDYYGIYLMDESWDMWYSRKNKNDYALQFMDNYKYDLKAMADRDYNHPSVILYSIANEVAEPAQEKGVELAKEMVAYLHELDDTRPVTGGFNLMIISRAAAGNGIYKEDGGREDDSSKVPNSSLMFNIITSFVGTGMNKGANSDKADKIVSPVLDALDIAGYNYASGRYPLEGKAHPDRVVFGSETFPQDIAKNWAMVKQYPYLIGDFMWTSWDYLGEAGAGAWAYTKDGLGFEKPYPWLLADMGAIDILGNENAEVYLAQAVWGLLDKPMIGVQPVNHPGVRPSKSTWRGTNAIPSWSWSNCEGNKAVVEVYSDAAKAELYLNGKKLGSKKIKDCKASFKCKYAAGKLEAVVFDASGREIGRNVLVSAGASQSIQVTPEVNAAMPGEILYFNVAVADENGITESNNDQKLTVSVEGGELLGFGSANPRTEEAYVDGAFTSYYGKAQAIVRAGESGKVTVTVASGKLGAGTASVEIK